MIVHILSGRVDHENYAIYGVFTDVEAAKKAAEPIIKRLGGRGPKNWLKPRGERDDWHVTDCDEVLILNVKRQGYDLAIQPCELRLEGDKLTAQPAPRAWSPIHGPQ